MVRVLADHISTSKGQSIIVESRPGAGGVIAAEAVARAPPDGNTLLINNNGMIISAILRKVHYDPRASFAPICYLADHRRQRRLALSHACRARGGRADEAG
jgi:tripartite-type tricarboxylate transporter receptor subunit TctC